MEAEAVSKYLQQQVRKMMQTLFGRLEMLNVLTERVAPESQFSVVTKLDLNIRKQTRICTPIQTLKPY